MNFKNEYRKIFKCPTCDYNLEIEGDNLRCVNCDKMYYGKKNTLFFIEQNLNINQEKGDGVIYGLKNYFKKFPKIFYFLAYIFGAPPINKSVNKFVSSLQNNEDKIINIGSGSKMINERIVNVDCFPYAGVNIVADAENLPFKEGSIDIVICDYVLEHVENPKKVVNEISRVLKTGGLVYVGLPFIISYHSAPGDYYRWTKNGARELLSDYEELELKPAYGPTSAMTNVLGEWFSVLLSFNFTILHQMWNIIFMIILSPLKVIDFVIGNFKSAQNIALGYYYIGKKK